MARVLDRRWAAIAVAVLLTLVAARVYTAGLGDYLIDDDEEGYFYAAWRAAEGELPYRDFLTPQLPAFVYAGAGVVAAAGRDPVALRGLSVLLTLLAAWGVFFAGRQLAGGVAGTAGMAGFLFNESVFVIGRAYRPEAMMLAAIAVGVALALWAEERRSRLGFGLASLAFGTGLLAKLFAALPWAAVVGAVLLAGVLPTGTAGTGRRRVADILALTLPGLGLVVGVMGAFTLATPDTYAAVFEHHLRQGAELSRLEVVRKGLAFFVSAAERHAAILALVPAGLLAVLHLGGRRGWLIALQLATPLAFLLLSRELFDRHLVYLSPATAVLFGCFVAWLLLMLRRPGTDRDAGASVPVDGGASSVDAPWPSPRWAAGLATASVLGALLIPEAFSLRDAARPQEVGTPRLAILVETLAPPDTRILSDYPGAGFFGQRATTYLGAGLSAGATESGQITADALIDELGQENVSVVLVDLGREGGHLANLLEFDAFMAYVRDRYDQLGHFWRHYQYQQVFLRSDLPRRDVDYGWVRVVRAEPTQAQVEAGGQVQVNLVLAVTDPRPERYTAFLHLIGPEGTVWSQGDGLLTNGLQRATDEWEPGEVVAEQLTVTVPSGAPPGTYRLAAGLYHRDTGQRQTFDAPTGPGEAFEAGSLEVIRPVVLTPADLTDVDMADSGALASAALEGQAVRTGSYQLIAAKWPERAGAGTSAAFSTLWRVAARPETDHQLRVTLLDAEGQPAGTTTTAPAAGWPTTAWRVGELAELRGEVQVDPAATGRLIARAEWLTGDGQAVGPPVSTGELDVAPLPPAETRVPDGSGRLDARLGTTVRLLAADVPENFEPGEALAFTLYWRADATPDTAFQVLVHVVNPAGDLVAQADGPPATGARPTTSWRPGEVVADHRTVPIPPEVSADTLTVLVGLYDPRDPALDRLEVTVDGEARPDGRVPVGQVNG